MSEDIESFMQYKNKDDRDKIKKYFTNPNPDVFNQDNYTLVFSTPSETGTSFFRIFEPMRALYKKFKDDINILYTEKLQPNHLKLGDGIVMHRCGQLHSHYLNVTKMWPKTEVKPLVVHDADDNEFNLPATHPMKALWEKAGKDKMSIHSLKNSDLITTTTPKLSQTFKNFNKNVHIFKNMFDWDLQQWNLDKDEIRRDILSDWYPTEDKIIIGWAGLTSHLSDIKRMAPIIKTIHDKYPNTYFILAGMALKDTSVEVVEENGEKKYKEVEVSEEETYTTKVRSMYEGIDKNRIKFLDALPLEEYGKFYSLFDISLAYIEHNAFNSCKSEIKVVESLRYGCIPIFSYYGGYRQLWDDKNIPTDVKDKRFSISTTAPKKWIDNISYWIENLEEGKKKAEVLKTYTDNIYNINEHIDDYYYFIREEIERSREHQININSQYFSYED